MQAITRRRLRHSGLHVGRVGIPLAIGLRLRVLLRRDGLDRELAEDRPSRASPELVLRSLQLNDGKERRRLSRCLLRVVREAEQCPSGLRRGPAIPIVRDPVLIWRDSLIGIAHRLTDPAPIPPAQIARVRLFLTDGVGPLFNPSSAHLLGEVVAEIETGVRSSPRE